MEAGERSRFLSATGNQLYYERGLSAGVIALLAQWRGFLADRAPSMVVARGVFAAQLRRARAGRAPGPPTGLAPMELIALGLGVAPAAARAPAPSAAEAQARRAAEAAAVQRAEARRAAEAQALAAAIDAAAQDMLRHLWAVTLISDGNSDLQGVFALRIYDMVRCWPAPVKAAIFELTDASQQRFAAAYSNLFGAGQCHRISAGKCLICLRKYKTAESEGRARALLEEVKKAYAAQSD